MDPHLRRLASKQEDIVAAWQLMAAGWSRRMVDRRVRVAGWRLIHRGVYALTQSPLSQRQLWIAATLSAPGTFLSHASAGSCFGFRPFQGTFETVTRAGRAGRRRQGGLLVFRSSVLEGDTTVHEGIPITTAARTLLDLAPGVGEAATRRAFREALRLKGATAQDVQRIAERHPRRPGSPFLVDLASRYADLPYHRTRSDAEGLALEVLHDAASTQPELNVRIAGEEADLVWRDRRLIVEIDGPQFHMFRDEDLRKQRRWERAGFTVRRLPSDDVYERPEQLVSLTR